MNKCLKFLAISAFMSLATACGTSTVQMVVVRPAMINARPYGDTVSVLGFQSPMPFLQGAAEALRMDVEQRIVASPGGVVRLMQGPAGLQVSGSLLEHGVTSFVHDRPAQCTDNVTVVQNGVKTQQSVTRNCVYRRIDWRVRVVAHVRVSTAQGQLIYLRSHMAEESGVTSEQVDIEPSLPYLEGKLSMLRARVAEQIAAVVAPHRDRVDVVFFDCEEPAKQACAAGVQQFAASQYDQAEGAFTDAIGRLGNSKPADQAEAYWNRGLVYQFSRRFDQAMADFRKSCELESRMACDRQMQSVEMERGLHDKLIDEGLGR